VGSFSSIYTGVSGINANSAQLTLIGNNVANMNTVGFKSNRATFADLVQSALAPGVTRPVSGGTGVAIGAAQLNYAQGPIGASINPLDWAIDGRGFFVVKNTAGNTFYTRAGQFKLNVDARKSRLVNPDGLTLQGFLADDEGTIGSTVADLEVDSDLAAKATAAVSLTANLDASASALAGDFDADDPSTYNFATSQTIYDGQEGDSSHTLTLYFSKTDDNTWDVHAQVDGGDVTTAEALAFTEDGVLTSGGEQTLSLTIPIDGDPPSTLTQSITLDLTGTTQYGSPSSTVVQSQDGYAAGTLESISLGRGGIISGHYSNQQRQTVARLALASFEDPQGLTQVGGGLLAESEASGEPTTLAPGDQDTESGATVGEVQANALELSNVDLGENFVDMIAAQLGFQASSRMIQTTDEILQVLINLRR
jgi:flagellar hook protein FlgE